MSHCRHTFFIKLLFTSDHLEVLPEEFEDHDARARVARVGNAAAEKVFRGNRVQGALEVLVIEEVPANCQAVLDGVRDVDCAGAHEPA